MVDYKQKQTSRRNWYQKQKELYTYKSSELDQTKYHNIFSKEKVFLKPMILLFMFRENVEHYWKNQLLALKFDKHRKEKEWTTKIYENFKKKKTTFKKLIESSINQVKHWNQIPKEQVILLIIKNTPIIKQ
jgi:hypothetical protein